MVARDVRLAGVRRRAPAHAQARGRGPGHRRRRGLRRRLVHVGDIDRHTHRVAGGAVAHLDGHRVAGLGLVVIRDALLGLDLTGRGVERERGLVGPLHRVGQGVVVRVGRRRDRRAHVGVRRGVLCDLAGQLLRGERRGLVVVHDGEGGVCEAKVGRSTRDIDRLVTFDHIIVDRRQRELPRGCQLPAWHRHQEVLYRCVVGLGGRRAFTHRHRHRGVIGERSPLAEGDGHRHHRRCRILRHRGWLNRQGRREPRGEKHHRPVAQAGVILQHDNELVQVAGLKIPGDNFVDVRDGHT